MVRCSVVSAKELEEYVENVRLLGKQKPGLFSMMFDRQVQSALLPGLHGSRADLEGHLWQLLVLCLNGPDFPPPPMDDDHWNRACLACESRVQFGNDAPAAFPTAAGAVRKTLEILRETGIYPPPKLAKGAP